MASNSIITIQKFLDKVGIENKMEQLPNGKSILTIEITKQKKWGVFVEPQGDNNQVRLYTLFCTASTKAKDNICRIINGYNKEYGFVKFFYQESSQGAMVLASYSIPSLESGLEWFLEMVLDKFVAAIDDAYIKVPAMVFSGEIANWYFSDND